MSDSLPPLNGLSLDRLRNFLAFADKGSIAKAAPESLARQALISRQIGELEQYFSTELTVRRGKTLALSEAGENLANLVRSQFQDLAACRTLPRCEEDVKSSAWQPAL